MKTLQAPLDKTQDGTHLGIQATTEIRTIACLDEEAHEEGYDSDGQCGSF